MAKGSIRRRFLPSPEQIGEALIAVREGVARLLGSMTDDERDALEKDEKLKLDMLSSVVPNSVEDVLEDIVRFAMWRDALVKAAKQPMENQRVRRARNERLKQQFRALALAIVQPLGGRYEAADFLVFTSKGTRKLVISKPTEVPRAYQREIPATWEPDEDKIEEALKNGETFDWAYLAEPETELNIRPR